MTPLVGSDFIPKRLVAVIAEKGERLLLDGRLRAGIGHVKRCSAGWADNGPLLKGNAKRCCVGMCEDELAQCRLFANAARLRLPA